MASMIMTNISGGTDSMAESTVFGAKAAGLCRFCVGLIVRFCCVYMALYMYGLYTLRWDVCLS